SSTITEDEIHEQEDTCQKPVLTILLISFMRPEKGIEYLLDAVSRLQLNRPWRLLLVGPREQFGAYAGKLDELIIRRGISAQTSWGGYVTYGPDMWNYFRLADVFVLPTL